MVSKLGIAESDDGQSVMEVPKAAKEADIIHLLVPDMEQTSVYNADISTSLSEGKALCFLMVPLFVEMD